MENCILLKNHILLNMSFFWKKVILGNCQNALSLFGLKMPEFLSKHYNLALGYLSSTAREDIMLFSGIPYPKEGVHCTLQIALAVCGDEEVDMSIYGHYTDITTSPEMERLDSELPVWSKGGEWAHYVSHLVNIKV